MLYVRASAAEGESAADAIRRVATEQVDLLGVDRVFFELDESGDGPMGRVMFLRGEHVSKIMDGHAVLFALWKQGRDPFDSEPSELVLDDDDDDEDDDEGDRVEMTEDEAREFLRHLRGLTTTQVLLIAEVAGADSSVRARRSRNWPTRWSRTFPAPKSW